MLGLVHSLPCFLLRNNSIDENTAIIGARFDDDGGKSSGSAYILSFGCVGTRPHETAWEGSSFRSSEASLRSSVYLLADWVKNAHKTEKRHQSSLGSEEPDGLGLYTNIRRSHFASANVPSTQISAPESFLNGKNTSQIPIVPLRRPTAEKRMKCRDSGASFILLGFSAYEATVVDLRSKRCVA